MGIDAPQVGLDEAARHDFRVVLRHVVGGHQAAHEVVHGRGRSVDHAARLGLHV